MAGKTATIEAKALEIIGRHADGIRYTHLVKAIQAELPDAKENTIQGTIWDLHRRRAADVYKPAVGLFRLTRFRGIDGEALPTSEAARAKPVVKEEVFYKPFAEWLVNETEDCTKAIPVGGNRFKDKWGTPDVVGIKKPRPGDIVPTPVEIVSAEIKTNPNDLITAFGQACAYKLFSHKAYLVVSRGSPDAVRSKLDSLCLIFGIGMVVFTPDPENPDFEIRVRPAKHEPDTFYVNQYMKHVAAELFG